MELDDGNGVFQCFACIAEIKQRQGKYDDACISLSEAAAIYKELGDRSEMADCLESIGKIKEDQGLYEDACISLNEAAAICKELGDRFTMALYLQRIGDIKQRQGKYDDAYISLNEAVEIFKELDHRYKIAECLISIAKIKIITGQHDDALALFSQAYAILKKGRYASLMVDYVESVATINPNHGLFDDAFISLNGAWAAASDPWDQSSIVRAVSKLLDIWRQSNNLTSMSTETEELLDVLNETRGMVDSLCDIGKVRLEKQLYKEAMESFCAAYELLEGLEGGWGLVECLRSLATVQEKQGDPVKHIQFLVRLARALGPIVVPGLDESPPTEGGYMVVLRAGRLLGTLKNHVEVPERLRIDVARLYVHVAIALHARESHREARSILLKAGQFFQRPDEWFFVMRNLMRLRDALLQAGYTHEADVALEEQNRVRWEHSTEIQWSDWFGDVWSGGR
ncbi:hypothetical protein FRB95_014507 [Tulasnella sp. JGI-2019a]|nr:hypothetical protein FRB95_014507 [Tulasnella sp. JGI-2019a]